MIARKANEEDAARIAEIERAVFSDAWSEDAVRETMCQKTAEIYVAEDRKTIVGYIVIYTVLDESEVVRIAVDAGFRERGTGGFLLDTVISEGALKGILKSGKVIWQHAPSIKRRGSGMSESEKDFTIIRKRMRF